MNKSAYMIIAILFALVISTVAGADDNQNGQQVASPNKVLYDYLGAPVMPPADLDPAYNKEGLTKAITLAAKQAGITLDKIKVDDSEFPFLVGVVSKAGQCDQLIKSLREMDKYTYGGAVGGGTLETFNIMPYSAFPPEDSERINHRMMLRLQAFEYRMKRRLSNQ